MRTLKIALSVLAAFVVAAGTAMTGGLFHASPLAVQITLAAAGIPAIFGLQVYAFTPATSRLLALAAGVMTAIGASHIGEVQPGTQPHPWFWSAFALATVVVGLLGHPAPADKPVAPLP